MTATIRTRRAMGPVTIVGLILVPLVVAGLLLWALWNPQDRLDTVSAAIVNNDSPVTVDGQTIPLGRQLAAELVGSGTTTSASDESGTKGSSLSNYTWTLTNEETAAAGLADGTYAAVVTIPENFSAAATSFSGDADAAEQAVLDVTTSDRGRLVDDAISQTITQTAASLLGRTLTTTYLENVFVGFTTLNEQLSEAADGASSLASGTTNLATGASQLAAGTTSLAEGAGSLASGVTALSSGIGSLAAGADQLASGSSQLSGGVAGLSSGIAQLSGGLTQIASQGSALPGGLGSLASNAQAVADGAAATASQAAADAVTLRQLATDCPAAAGAYCTQIAAAADAAEAAADAADQTAGGAQGIFTGIDGLVTPVGELVGAVDQSAGAASELAGGAGTLSGASSQLADGASQLASGLAETGSGADQLATGASSLAAGVTDISAGTQGISDGVTGVASGTTTLADGLQSAATAIPRYTDAEGENLAQVVADPVSAGNATGISFGSSSLPLYTVLALWIGALATFIMLRARPARALESTRSSLALTLRTAALPALVGAIQGLLVALLLGIAQGLTASDWFGFAAVAVVAGIAFAAVNQALIAVFGGGGRFIAMVIALVVLATGVVSTVPAVLDTVSGILPVGPAIDGIHAATTAASGSVAASVAGLVIWALAGVAVTTLATMRRRTVSARAFTALTA